MEEEFLKEVVSLLGISIVPCVLIGWILSKWFETRLGNSVAFEYAKKMEMLRTEEQNRLKAACIAELFAEWLSFPEDQRHLNRLTLEAFLWLPDDIVADLSSLLSHKADAPNIRSLIVRVRKHLLSSKSNIEPWQVIIFTQQSSQKQREAAVEKVQSLGA